MAVKGWGGLLALSVIATVLLELAHLPAALLLGPMAAAVLMAVRGAGLQMPGRVMTMAQGLVGLMIAGILPPSLIPEIAARWQVVGAGTLSTLVIAALLGWLLTRSGLLPGTTAIWGSAPGAASVMTLLSQDYGADIRLVAFMQYLRVACVALAAALVARAFGAHGHAADPVIWFQAMPPLGIALTVALAALFSFGGQALKLPGGPFLTPMLGGIALSWSGAVTLMLPPWLLALAYCGIGWAIGLRFTPAILAHAARVFPRVLGAILTLIAACGGAAAVLVVVADVDPLTAYLATSPGGADSVAILSASTHVDVPFVMSMQMARFLLVLLTGPAVARALSGRQARAG
ncbi:MAG: AbrB family transcriptional regulator [Limimaricola sp.]|nr:AbrB family transcriptional regulator [Limimaricola sp.]